MDHASALPWNKLGSWLDAGMSWMLPVPWIHELRSPFAFAPAWLKRWVKWDHLGAELGEALGRGKDFHPDRPRALLLARQGASPWFERGHETAPTNLQLAVSLGWCDVAEALLGNDTHWFWSTRWGRRIQQMHLASLWLAVDNEETESLLRRVCPLEYIEPQLLGGSRSLYHLAMGLGERGLLRSFAWMYDHLPHAYRSAMAQNVEMGRWSMDGVLFMVERHPELLHLMVDEKRPLAHFLAINPKGQELLHRLGCSIPLDEEGNSPLLAWCIAAFQWKAGPVTHASSGLPASTLYYLPDTPEYAWEALMGLLRLGVEPRAVNRHGLPAWEQAPLEADVFIWSGMRQSHQKARELRVEMLQSWIRAQQLQAATGPVAGSRPVSRL